MLEHAAILTAFAYAIGSVASLAQEQVRVEASELFTVIGSAGSEAAIELEVSEIAFERLSSLKHFALADFQLSSEQSVSLNLERFWVWGPGTRFVIASDQGDQPIPPPPVVFFRGSISGDSETQVYLSASPFGINVMIRAGEHQYFLSPSTRGSDGPGSGPLRHTLFDGRSGSPDAPPARFQCEPLTAPGSAPAIGVHLPGAEVRGAARVALVALEADHEFRQLFGSNTAAVAYACELLASASFIYEADINMKLAVSFVRVWDTAADPYDSGGSGDQVEQFRVFWNANMASVQRNVAHLLSGRDLGGGTAYLDQMCNGAFSYGVSGNLAGTFPRPLQDGHAGNWDLVVVAHELGHNFRSPHTQRYEPPVDRCVTNNDGVCAQGTAVCQQGTIMSYCHLCPGEMRNIDLTFGPTVSSFIQGGIRSCIGQARNPCFVNAGFSGSEQGTSSNPYRTITKGTWFVVPHGSVSIAAGAYPEQIRICQPMTLVASSGMVSIGN